MNNNKLIAVFAVVIIVAAGAGAVYLLTRDNGAEENTIIDARGREVVVPDEINSILAIKSCSLQLVSYFEAVEKVAWLDVNESFTDTGRTHTFILKDLLKDLDKVDPANHEAVAATKVDIIISSTISTAVLDEEQNKYGIPVFAINADVEFDSEIMYQQLRSLGKLFKEEKRAEELVSGIRSLVSGISDNVDKVDGVTAYACGMNFFGAAAKPFERTSGDYLPFVYSKVDNAFPSSANKQPYNTTQEAVIAKNPQMIFIDGIGANTVKTYIQANYGTLKLIDAVSNGEIYKTMIYKNWGTNWLNQLINVYYVASIVHEGEFSWIFEDKANEIIQLFYPGTSVTYSGLAAAQAGGGCGKITL